MQFNYHVRYDQPFEQVSIAIVGKYTKLEDAYLSVIKALKHSSLACKRKLEIKVAFMFIFFFAEKVSVVYAFKSVSLTQSKTRMKYHVLHVMEARFLFISSSFFKNSGFFGWLLFNALSLNISLSNSFFIFLFDILSR